MSRFSPQKNRGACFPLLISIHKDRRHPTAIPPAPLSASQNPRLAVRKNTGQAASTGMIRPRDVGAAFTNSMACLHVARSMQKRIQCPRRESHARTRRNAPPRTLHRHLITRGFAVNIEDGAGYPFLIHVDVLLDCGCDYRDASSRGPTTCPCLDMCCVMSWSTNVHARLHTPLRGEIPCFPETHTFFSIFCCPTQCHHRLASPLASPFRVCWGKDTSDLASKPHQDDRAKGSQPRNGINIGAQAI